MSCLVFRIALPTILALLLFFDVPAPIAADHGDQTKAIDAVILLHGLGRTSRSMVDMAEGLELSGFHSVNLDYPSRQFSIPKLALDTIPRGIQQCRSKGAGSIHFVTHSMGGILLRYYLSQRTIEGLGRVVMLSPPNQGSEVADALKDSPFYLWYNGPAGQQLGTDPNGFVLGLGPVAYPVGVITGNSHALFDAWLAEIIPGADDGKVAVKRARVKGMADFLVLPYSHSFIMKKPLVVAQTIHFLRHGRFEASETNLRINQMDQ